MIKTADVADNADTKGKVMILIRDRCGAPRAIRARSLSRARRDGPIWLRQCPPCLPRGILAAAELGA